MFGFTCLIWNILKKILTIAEGLITQLPEHLYVISQVMVPEPKSSLSQMLIYVYIAYFLSTITVVIVVQF